MPLLISTVKMCVDGHVSSHIIYSRGTVEQIEVGERLLLFGAESFLFQFAIQKFKDQDL